MKSRKKSNKKKVHGFMERMEEIRNFNFGQH